MWLMLPALSVGLISAQTIYCIYLDHSPYLVFCAHVQNDRQALLWWHPSTCRVEGQLAHWDSHAIAAQVPQSQDPLSIGHTHSL